ncbi:hypothetical protein [Microbulbifer taiwanensis]|uniref:Lipoprotein n=1 Tax=Microbulbifer taiwanensis TaxID=986746 RepID=A0ABW1YL34_9GAMM|nr:hypothetical protein [Microbulbifer taiwanensis]
MLKNALATCMFAAAFTLGGCATIFDGSNQDIMVSTLNDSSPESTQCQIRNEEGEWRVVANTTSVIHKDGNQLEVECENASQKGVGSASPSFQAQWLLLDLVWDACILTASCIIDGATNAFYKYPSTVVVNMADKEGVE